MPSLENLWLCIILLLHISVYSFLDAVSLLCHVTSGKKRNVSIITVPSSITLTALIQPPCGLCSVVPFAFVCFVQLLFRVLPSSGFRFLLSPDIFWSLLWFCSSLLFAPMIHLAPSPTQGCTACNFAIREPDTKILHTALDCFCCSRNKIFKSNQRLVVGTMAESVKPRGGFQWRLDFAQGI